MDICILWIFLTLVGLEGSGLYMSSSSLSIGGSGGLTIGGSGVLEMQGMFESLSNTNYKMSNTSDDFHNWGLMQVIQEFGRNYIFGLPAKYNSSGKNQTLWLSSQKGLDWFQFFACLLNLQ